MDFNGFREKVKGSLPDFANLQRENILPSERAFALKMKLEAVKHQGKRSDLTSRQVGDKLKAADIVGEKSGESGRQVQQYIRLTELIPQFLDMVDHKQLAFNPAVELSYLKKEEQEQFLEAMEYAQAAPSLSQAQRVKKLSQSGECTLDAMFFATPFWRKLQKVFGECCIAILAKVATTIPVSNRDRR